MRTLHCHKSGLAPGDDATAAGQLRVSVQQDGPGDGRPARTAPCVRMEVVGVRERAAPSVVTSGEDGFSPGEDVTTVAPAAAEMRNTPVIN